VWKADACNLIDRETHTKLPLVSLPLHTTTDLAQELRVTPEIASSILKNARNAGASSDNQEELKVTAKDVLLRSAANKPIITFCKSIDTILGGGVQIGQITG
jgi:hypothetical protein